VIDWVAGRKLLNISSTTNMTWEIISITSNGEIEGIISLMAAFGHGLW